MPFEILNVFANIIECSENLWHAEARSAEEQKDIGREQNCEEVSPITNLKHFKRILQKGNKHLIRNTAHAAVRWKYLQPFRRFWLLQRPAQNRLRLGRKHRMVENWFETFHNRFTHWNVTMYEDVFFFFFQNMLHVVIAVLFCVCAFLCFLFASKIHRQSKVIIRNHFWAFLNLLVFL